MEAELIIEKLNEVLMYQCCGDLDSAITALREAIAMLVKASLPSYDHEL